MLICCVCLCWQQRSTNQLRFNKNTDSFFFTKKDYLMFKNTEYPLSSNINLIAFIKFILCRCWISKTNSHVIILFFSLVYFNSFLCCILINKLSNFLLRTVCSVCYEIMYYLVFVLELYMAVKCWRLAIRELHVYSEKCKCVQVITFKRSLFSATYKCLGNNTFQVTYMAYPS